MLLWTIRIISRLSSLVLNNKDYIKAKQSRSGQFLVETFLPLSVCYKGNSLGDSPRCLRPVMISCLCAGTNG